MRHKVRQLKMLLYDGCHGWGVSAWGRGFVSLGITVLTRALKYQSCSVEILRLLKPPVELLLHLILKEKTPTMWRSYQQARMHYGCLIHLVANMASVVHKMYTPGGSSVVRICVLAEAAIRPVIRGLPFKSRISNSKDSL